MEGPVFYGYAFSKLPQGDTVPLPDDFEDISSNFGVIEKEMTVIHQVRGEEHQGDRSIAIEHKP